MIWFLIIGLAAAALAAMIFLFKLPRAAASSIASALLIGLAGYAWQGEPSMPAAPKAAISDNGEEGPMIVDARKRFYREDAPPRPYLILADGFARSGQYQEVSEILNIALATGTRDSEAWVALGNALVAHADGALAPPALMAFERARQIDPDNLAPGFFVGVADLRQGKLVQAHKTWSEALNVAPENAPGRAELEQRRAQLEQLMRQIAEQ